MQQAKITSESKKGVRNVRYNIIAKHATEGGADAVRLSPHYYVKEKELNQVARALCEIAGVNASGWFEGNELI